MTSPTASLSRGVALAALLAAGTARADWRFTPTLDLRATLTDNVALQDEHRARSRFVMEIAPGFLLTHSGSRLVASAAWQEQLFLIAGGRPPGTRRSARYLRAEARARLVERFLYLDASADIAQQPISVFGPVTMQPRYASSNRAEVKSWRISPYLSHRFGTLATSELRYTRDHVDAGGSGLGNSEGDTLSARLDSGSAFPDAGWSLQLRRQAIRDAVAPETRMDSASAAVRYRLTRTLSLTVGAGYDSYDYQALGGSNSGPAWNVGMLWSPGPRTRIQAGTGRKFYGPSHTLSASHRTRHSVWGLNYGDQVASTRTNVFIPATFDTAGTLDRLFRPAYSDPDQRALAVQALIRQAGLPPALAENINFFSNRYSLQKTLRASLAVRKGRSSAVASAYRQRRDMLSTRESDSILLGNSPDPSADKVSLRGVNATLIYALSPRTSVQLAADATRSASRVTQARASTGMLRLQLRHKLSSNTSAMIEWRRINGNTAVLGGTRYTENALAVAVSMQL